LVQSQALRELSLTSDLVVATGGGVVVQHQNWTYLRNGITVWLDVPVPALAHRVTAVGTGTRPLLGGDCGGYDQALARLSKIFEERGPAYANADITVSLQSLALMLACEDVSELTPTAITVQVIVSISFCSSDGKHQCQVHKIYMCRYMTDWCMTASSCTSCMMSHLNSKPS
jgi:shikimate kinase